MVYSTPCSLTTPIFIGIQYFIQFHQTIGNHALLQLYDLIECNTYWSNHGFMAIQSSIHYQYLLVILINHATPIFVIRPIFIAIHDLILFHGLFNSMIPYRSNTCSILILYASPILIGIPLNHAFVILITL